MEYALNIIGLPKSSLKRAFAPIAAFGAHLYDHFIPHARNNYSPHLLGRRSLALMSGLLVAVKIFTLAVVVVGPVDYAFSSAITENNIISLTNESRSQYGIGTLTENSMLDSAAQAKANDMLAKGYFAHVTPDGQTPWSFITAAGYNYLMAGENLAVNFSQAEDVETAWMNSPDHKANILNKNFVDIGIGISEGTYQDHTAIFVVQEFGTPAQQQVSLSNTPTQVQAASVPAPATQAAKLVIPALTQVSTKTASQNNTQPQTLGDSQNKTTAPAAAAVPEAVNIQSGNVEFSGSNVDITAQVSGPATKVIAYFGQQAIMLDAKNNNAWSGEVAAGVLAQSNTTVHLEAFGMQGQSDTLQLADFSANTIDNYNLAGTQPQATVSIWGRVFNPNSMENRFYLVFIAMMLTSLVLAIAIKRHVQHLSLITNSSFVIILACLLWMGGIEVF